MSDNIFQQLNNMRFGQGKQDPAADSTNEKTTFDALFDQSGNHLYTAAKIGVAPIKLNNVFEVGLTKQLDSEGIAGKNIISLLQDAHGGFWAKLLHAIFIKNREITDHTAGVGGEGSGDAGNWGGGGSADSGGSFADYNTADFGSFVSQPDFPSFDYIPIAAADLGSFSPPSFGVGQNMGMELG